MCSVAKRPEVLRCRGFIKGQTIRLTSKYGVVLKTCKVHQYSSVIVLLSQLRINYPPINIAVQRVYLTNRFHVAMRLFCNRSQMTSKCREIQESGTRAVG